MRRALDVTTLHPTGPPPTAGRSSTPIRRVPSARPWVDVDLRPGPAPSGRSPASTAPTWSRPDGRGDERPRVDRRRRRRRRWWRPARATRDRMPTAVTSLSSQRRGCRSARRAGQIRCRRPGRPARPGRAPGRAVRPRSRRRRPRRTAGPGRVVRGPGVRRTRARGRRRATRSVRPSRCTSAPAARANIATSSPIVPGPSTSTRSPGRQRRRPARRAARCRRARPARRARRRRCRAAACSDAGRDGELLGQRAGPAAADADLVPVRAHVLAARAGSAGSAVSRASCRP